MLLSVTVQTKYAWTGAAQSGARQPHLGSVFSPGWPELQMPDSGAKQLNPMTIFAGEWAVAELKNLGSCTGLRAWFRVGLDWTVVG